MKTIELSTASKSLSEYAKEFENEVVILTSHTKPVAAVISLARAELESLSLAMNPEFLAIIEKARAEFAQGRKLSLKEMRQQLL
jgi:PHD/YefM family antitoxin component YafN of YafNO toxin-antitoxin module